MDRKGQIDRADRLGDGPHAGETEVFRPVGERAAERAGDLRQIIEAADHDRAARDREQIADHQPAERLVLAAGDGDPGLLAGF